MRGDLLEPSVQSNAPHTESRRKAWRVGSQVYVAFFGGPLAVGAIALVNSGRLRMDGKSRALIAAAAVVGFAAFCAIAAAGGESGGSTLRLAQRGIGLLTYGVAYLLQRGPDRVYHYYGGGESAYGNLFYPGLVAVLAGLAVEVSIASAVGAA